MSLPPDNPIRTDDEDLLGRAREARFFVDEVLSLDSSAGLVVGVLGRWGSGKTSFVNLALQHFEAADVPVLTFNPWMFTGTEQLVTAFFVELSAQLRLRPALADVGASIEDYGESVAGMGWLPLLGPWIERGRGTAKFLGRIMQRRREGVSARRDKVREALTKFARPLVVVVDDIDRLTQAEIRDIFRLVRLTASFPNVIYVVAFDRKRVEHALTEPGIPGRDYLEKILQVGIDLPSIPSDVLTSQLIESLNAGLADIEKQGPFDESTWPDIFMEVVRPLVESMRDVRRLTIAAHGTVRFLDGQLALGDVLALEAIRVLLPDVFMELDTSVVGLTTPSSGTFSGTPEPPHLKVQVERLVGAAGDKSEVVNSLVRLLFPAAARHVGGSGYGPEWGRDWLRNRRVAHEDMLRLYLERVAGEGVEAFSSAERAWHLMTNAVDFERFLRSLPSEQQQDVVSALEVYEDEYTSAHAEAALPVLLNLLPDMPERRQGLFDLGTRMVVGRVVYRLLRAVAHEGGDVALLVSRLLPRLGSLSAKLDLIEDVGHREGRGHGIIEEGAAESLERSWRADVRAATVRQLSVEYDLLRVLYTAASEAEAGEDPLVVQSDPQLTDALLRSARSESRSQAMGSRSVQRQPVLAWDALTEIYGDESVLRERIEQLRSADLPSDLEREELIDLAHRYFSGWRPDRHN